MNIGSGTNRNDGQIMCTSVKHKGAEVEWTRKWRMKSAK